MNAFNPRIASVLDSNTGVQVIVNHYACATYVVGYVSKADRGMSNLLKAVSDMRRDGLAGRSKDTRTQHAQGG